MAKIFCMHTQQHAIAGRSWRGEAVSPRASVPGFMDSDRGRPMLGARWAGTFGAVGGAVGAGLMLATAQAVLGLQRSPLHVAELLGGVVRRVVPAVATPNAVGLIAAVVLGAMLGGLLGRLTWRPTHVFPRLLFLSILAPALWLCAQAFVIGRPFGAVGEVPWIPFTLGALAYAWCVAIVGSIRPRPVRTA